MNNNEAVPTFLIDVYHMTNKMSGFLIKMLGNVASAKGTIITGSRMMCRRLNVDSSVVCWDGNSAENTFTKF